MTTDIRATMWRNESCYNYVSNGEIGERDAARVMCFEMFELGNTDIPYTVYHNYIQPNLEALYPIYHESINQIRVLIESTDRDQSTDWKHTIETHRDFMLLALAIIDMVNKVTKASVRYVLWLAEKERVVQYYKGEEKNMQEYATAPIILSDLGAEGILFGYETMPAPITKEEI